jgi:hypothetical protein
MNMFFSFHNYVKLLTGLLAYQSTAYNKVARSFEDVAKFKYL